jgi:hypothetical protein
MDKREQQAIIDWVNDCPMGWIVKSYNLYPGLGEVNVELVRILDGEDDE